VLVLSATSRVADWIGFELGIKLKVDVLLLLFLVVESGSGWADWSLKNVDFLGTIINALVASWLGRWIFFLLNESNTDWFLAMLLALLLEEAVLLALDGDLLVVELLWVDTGDKELVVLGNIIFLQDLNVRSHWWPGVGVISCVVSKGDLSVGIFFFGVGAGQSPDSRGIILSLDMGSHRWSSICIVSSVVSEGDLGVSIILLRVGASESPDRGGVVIQLDVGPHGWSSICIISSVVSEGDLGVGILLLGVGASESPDRCGIVIQLDVRPHGWPGVGIIGGIVSESNLGVGILLLRVGASECPYCRSVILSLNVRSHWRSGVGVIGSVVSEGDLGAGILLFRIRTGESPDRSGVVGRDKTQEKSNN